MANSTEARIKYLTLHGGSINEEVLELFTGCNFSVWGNSALQLKDMQHWMYFACCMKLDFVRHSSNVLQY